MHTRVDEDLNHKDSEDRCKRQLPTTITPERSNTKNSLSEQTASTVRDDRILADFHFLQDRANFWQTDLF